MPLSFTAIQAGVYRSLRLTAPATAALLTLAVNAHAEAPSVVTSIKPLHSIAAAVMEGVGTPYVLIDGASSPHGYALKPSQAFLLQGADVVFWVGPELAPSLQKPIETMAKNAVSVELIEASGIRQLDIREGASFDAHDHDHEDGDVEDEHAGDDHDHSADEHDHAEEHEEAQGASDHDDHANEAEHDHAEHGAVDPHIWLNPENGIEIAKIMANTLAERDPANADVYKKNAAAFAKRISDLDEEISAELAPLTDRKFIVFHDAYHHFEHHYDIEASGSVTVSPEALSSADRIKEIQNKISELNVSCVFQEPQFDAKLVSVVLEGSNAKSAALDPLGTGLENGPGLYPQLLKGLADALKGCLGGAS
jgi:zinc transport system substrate-binding protein